MTVIRISVIEDMLMENSFFCLVNAFDQYALTNDLRITSCSRVVKCKYNVNLSWLLKTFEYAKISIFQFSPSPQREGDDILSSFVRCLFVLEYGIIVNSISKIKSLFRCYRQPLLSWNHDISNGCMIIPLWQIVCAYVSIFVYNHQCLSMNEHRHGGVLGQTQSTHADNFILYCDDCGIIEFVFFLRTV